MNIVILTGAGVSAESGLQTFRGADGLWEGHRVEDVATPEAFERNPELVQRFYNKRRSRLLDGTVHPNPAHLALARLEREYPGQVMLITQNIDDLHDRAGSKHLLHLHGELLKCRCVVCAHTGEIRTDLSTQAICPECDSTGTLRPDIVWFGEMPYHLDEISSALQRADLFVSIGTSGSVYPAAGFVAMAARNKASTLELNLEATSREFHDRLLGPASEVVPLWVAEVLGS
jgi:NAD-dependent deacetylase